MSLKNRNCAEPTGSQDPLCVQARLPALSAVSRLRESPLSNNGKVQACPETLTALVYRDDTSRLKLVDPLPAQVDALLEAEEDLLHSDLADFIPAEKWPRTELRRFSPPLYGYSRYSDCHTERQLVYLATLCQSLAGTGSTPQSEIAVGLSALVVAQAVDRHSSFCRWRNDRGGSHENTFAGKSLGMIWDFFEADPLHVVQSLISVLDDLRDSILAAKVHLQGDGTVMQTAAQELALPDDSVDVVYTDPPYYDAIPYSHLSDWPFVWMRRVGAFTRRQQARMVWSQRIAKLLSTGHIRRVPPLMTTSISGKNSEMFSALAVVYEERSGRRGRFCSPENIRVGVAT